MKEISFGLHRTALMKSIWKSLISETNKEATAGSEVRQRSWAKRTEEPDWSGDTWGRKIRSELVYLYCKMKILYLVLYSPLVKYLKTILSPVLHCCSPGWCWLTDCLAHESDLSHGSRSDFPKEMNVLTEESFKYNKNVQMRNVREWWTHSLWHLDG